MPHKNLFVCICMFLFMMSGAIGQKEKDTFKNGYGTISGQLLAVDSTPIELVSVSVIELKKNTLTDKNGNFYFDEIAPGMYTLQMQMLGAKKIDIKVAVEADKTTQINYQLTKENIIALQEVRVLARINKYSNKESFYVSRLPLKNIEDPQVHNTVPSALLQEQMTVSLGDAAKEIPGAGIPTIANQGRVTFYSRGFSTEPNARNGVASTAFSFIDPINLERFEAIKGPSATLFGTQVSSSYGGLYNRVTKKPFNGFGGEVSYTGGSWNYNRLTFDVNTPVNSDHTALFRMTGATTFDKSFQDNGFDNTIALAPSFSYQINDRMSVLVDVEYAHAKATSVVRFNPFVGNNEVESVADMKFPYDKTFLGDNIYYTTQMLNVFAQMNYKISSGWTSQTVISRARSTIDGDITALTGRTDSTLRASIMVGNTNFIATDLQQNFIGDFYIGHFRNRIVAGLDYYNDANTFDRTTVNGPTVNFINTPASYNVTQYTLDSSLSKGTLRKERNGDDDYAAYISDVFNVTDRLSVMGSVRIDRYHYEGVHSLTADTTAGRYNQTAISHKSGIVYQLIKDKLSLFGNYMNGFFNVSGSDKDGNQFKPQHANQLEYGIKADVFDHRLVGTVSYYDIKVKNVLRTDPEDANYSIQDGTQYSRGIELDLNANPFEGFNIVAGYAYNKSIYTQADSSVVGLTPAGSGPAKMLNFWLSYAIPKGKLKGLGFGFGGNTGSKSYQTNTQTAKIIIPSYKMFDATVFYDRPKFRIGFKVDNLTSEKVWSVRLTPQPPARFLGSFAFKF